MVCQYNKIFYRGSEFVEKQRALDYILERESLILGISDNIWEVAETAFEEHKSIEYLCDALESEGFEIERNVADIETAFTGRYGEGYPVIGILGEFDALSGISQVPDLAKKEALKEGGNGHGCGHNLLGSGSLAAAIGIKKYLMDTEKSGTVIYFGCPGEEGGSGKTFMAREGVFDELDIALTWHPASVNGVASISSLANYQILYKFHGISAHAAANPHDGRSALDAVELLNIGVQFLREHIIQDARIHYAITDTGGFSPNVVQPYAEVLYLIRAPETPQVKEIYERVNDIAKGAALMTGTRLEMDFVKAASNLVPNNILEAMLYKNLNAVPIPEYTEDEIKYAKEFMESTGEQKNPMTGLVMKIPDSEKRKLLLSKLKEPILDFVLPYFKSDQVLPGSTDVGDVSWICPTSQIAAASWSNNTAAHSWQAVSQGKSSIAHKSVIYAGQVLAATAIDLINDTDKIEEAKEELKSRLGDNEYVCPIPKGVKPRSISGR